MPLSSTQKRDIKKNVINILSRLPGASSNVLFVKGYTTLRQVVDDQKEKQPSVWFRNVHSATNFKRVNPIAVNNNEHWKFKDNAPGITTHSQPTYCAEIANARIFGSNGAIITSDNLLIEDVSPELGRNANEHSILSVIKMSKPLHLTGRSFVLAGTEGSGNYFHWITDALPKIEIARKAGVDFNAVDNIIVNSVDKQFQKKAFELLGLYKFNIISLQQHPYILCDKLIIGSPTCLSGNISSWIVEFLRKSFAEWMIIDDRFAGKDIYISRERSGKRRLLNEGELENKLSHCGFEKVFLEELSFEDQVKLFFNANTIVGVHGAGFTNLCFCSDKTSVVELFPPTYVNQCYWNISSALKLQYHYLIGEGADNTTTKNHLIDNDFMLSTFQINLLEKFFHQNCKVPH